VGVNPTGRLSATVRQGSSSPAGLRAHSFPSSVPTSHPRRYGVRPREAGGTPVSMGGLTLPALRQATGSC
jgi:hypothetical protein